MEELEINQEEFTVPDAYVLFGVTKVKPRGNKPFGPNKNKRIALEEIRIRINKLLKRFHKTLPVEEAVEDILDETNPNYISLISVHTKNPEFLDTPEIRAALLKNLKSHLVKHFETIYNPIIIDDDDLAMPTVEVEVATFEDE